MHRFVFLLRGAAAGLIVAAASATALAKPVPIGRRLVHPDGVSIVLQTIDFRDDSIVLSATIANPGERAIRLNRARSFVLDDRMHGVYHLNPPADNPRLRIPAHAQMTADLVFIGPLASAARGLTLSINRGVGTSDNPYDDTPAFSATLPADGQAEAKGGLAASHPDGAGLRVRRILGTPTECVVSLLATNGNDRTIVLNQDRGLVLTDARGVAAPVEAPSDNRELVVPPGDRLDANLIFDCRTLDAGGALTLITNRGTAGTTDNPYDTLPVFALKIPVKHSGAAPPASSRATVAPIARSQLSAPAEAAAILPTPSAPASPAAAPAPAAPGPAAPAAAPAPAAPGPASPAAAPAPAAPGPAAPAAAGPATPAPLPRPPLPAPAKIPVPRSVPQLEAALHAKRTYRGLRIVLSADALFGSAPDTLLASADPLLAQLAALIAKTRPHEVEVTGHTDSVGTDADNLTLSKERAHAVAAWLEAHAARIRPHFVEEGFGRTRPVAPNHKSDGSDNPAGRAQNRRVEVLLRR